MNSALSTLGSRGFSLILVLVLLEKHCYYLVYFTLLSRLSYLGEELKCT
jgi:hypothetical protein